MKGLSSEAIRAQLSEILNSKDFLASKRLKDFLIYIVEETLRGKGEQLKAYSIALDVFGLGKDFDPRVNPLIRTEAGRLRSKLDHYYLLNPTAKVHISMPKGSYAAVFREMPLPSDSGAASSLQTYSFATAPARHTGQDKPTVLVLPFANINSTEKVERFSAGIVNEISIALTRFRELNVFDYNRYMQLSLAENKVPNVKNKARFVLSGSVQEEDNNFKIWITLGDTTTNCNIWAERFDGNVKQTNLFELQERIAEAVVYRIAADFGLIHRTLLREFESGETESSKLQEAVLLYHQWTNVLSFADFEKTLKSVEEAAQDNPEHMTVQAMLADLYASDHQWSYNLVENALEKSLQMATKAINQDPECQIAHMAMAINHFLRDDKEKFLVHAERTLEINPSSSNALTALSSWYGLLGFLDKSMELTEKLFELNPASPGWCYFNYALFHYMHGDYEASLREGNKISMPERLLDSLIRVAAAGMLGNFDEVRPAAAALLKTYPEFKKTGQRILSNTLPHRPYLDLVLTGFQQAGFFTAKGSAKQGRSR